MSRDDANPDRSPDARDRLRSPRSPPFAERRFRAVYSEKTVRGVTVATIADRSDDDAWIRSTLVVDNEP